MGLETALFWAWLHAPETVLGVRLLACALVLPVLYRALGDPGQGWSGDVPRRAFFALLGAAVFFTLTARWIPEEHDPDAGRGFEAFVRGSMNLRLLHANFPGMESAEGGTVTPKKTIEDLTKAARLIPQSAYIQRYSGIALADQGDYAGSLERLLRASAILEQRAPDRGREERRLWSDLYGPRPPTPAQVRQAAVRLDQFGLGWIGRVAVLAAYARIGPKAAPDSLRDQVQDAAAGWLVGMIGAVIMLGSIVPLGLISLAVGFILIRTRVLRPAPRLQNPIGSVLWESFIVMLALYAAPSFITLGGRRLSPETQPGLVALLLISADLLQVFSVLYLAWRLRTRGLGLAEIGLTRQNLGANVFLGVMAATIITPLAWLIGILTEQVSQKDFPNIAPPFHPLGLYTATSGSLEIRAALFLAAVVGAPLVEETFFRGALFGALRRRFGFWPGVLLSAGFFAILHPQLPLGFLPIALIGASFAILAEWRQSLVPGMVAHAINNSIAFLGLTLLFPHRG